MRVKDFLDVLALADNSNTVYAKGTFGQPLTHDVIDQKSRQYPSWYKKDRVEYLKTLVNQNVFVFDCIGLVKAVLWGWNADSTKPFGGATYQKDGIPDVNEDGMLALCKKVSSDMSNIKAGEFLWMKGHCGVYVGNGIVIECTPAWQNGVQKTRLEQRHWEKHGLIPYVVYDEDVKPTATPTKKEEEVYKMQTLKYDSRGNDVTIFESLMKKLGYYNGTIDEHFGNGCLKACNDFQIKYPECGTNGKPDGSFGSRSWNKLLSLVKG